MCCVMGLTDHFIWSYLYVVQSERKVEVTLTVPSSDSGLYKCSTENVLGSEENILKFYESGIAVGLSNTVNFRRKISLFFVVL